MTDHTPGKWAVKRDEGNNRVRVVTNDGVVGIATVHALIHQDANARLIAAAPKLLHALADIMREYRHIMGDDTAEITAAYEALAEADPMPSTIKAMESER